MRPTHPRPRILRRRTTSDSPAATRPLSAAGILLAPLPLAILCLVAGSGCDPQVGAGQTANGPAAMTTAPGTAAVLPTRASTPTTPTSPPVPAPGATADRGGPAHPMAAPITAPAPIPMSVPTSVPPPATTAPLREAGGSPPHDDPAPPPPAGRPTLASTSGRPNATTAPPAPATPTRGPAASPMGGYPAEVVARTNEQRRTAGCPALRVDPVLTAVAQAHSADMALAAYFSHVSPGGRNPFDRITAAGFAFSTAAENIAAGQRDPGAVMQAWMNSPGHRANILNCGLTRIGVGVATGGPYGMYWTQDFATPAR